MHTSVLLLFSKFLSKYGRIIRGCKFAKFETVYIFTEDYGEDESNLEMLVLLLCVREITSSRLGKHPATLTSVFVNLLSLTVNGGSYFKPNNSLKYSAVADLHTFQSLLHTP
jgi:hypothetical protein